MLLLNSLKEFDSERTFSKTLIRSLVKRGVFLNNFKIDCMEKL
jgi:hypothetical protein